MFENLIAALGMNEFSTTLPLTGLRRADQRRCDHQKHRLHQHDGLGFPEQQSHGQQTHSQRKSSAAAYKARRLVEEGIYLLLQRTIVTGGRSKSSGVRVASGVPGSAAGPRLKSIHVLTN